MISTQSVPAEDDIDRRLISLRAEILSLSKIRNANYSATSKLPSEILAYIFEFISQTPLCEGGENRLVRKHYTWIKEVTHICRNWRSVALNSSILWSSVLMSPPEWAEQVLQRAKHTPVDLIFPALTLDAEDADSFDQEHRLFKAGLANPDQVRSIIMPLEADRPDGALKLFSELVAPYAMSLLESLSIQSTYEACIVPDNLFRALGSFPRLWELKLLNCVVDLDAPCFHGLRVLEIHADAMETGITLNSLMTTLRAMRNLEILELDDVLSPNTEVADPPNPLKLTPFELPCLHKLALMSDDDSSALILPFFRIVKAPHIRDVVVNFSIHEVDNLKSIYSFLRVGSTSSEKKPGTQDLVIHKPTPGLSSFEIAYTQADPAGQSRTTLNLPGIAVGLEALWSSIPNHSSIRSFTLSLTFADLPLEPSVLNIAPSLAGSHTLTDLQIPYLAFVNEDRLADWSKTPSFVQLCRLELDCINRKPPNVSLKWLANWTWRLVALASPRLWSSALLHPFDWACEVLQRTRSAPVDLVFPTLGDDALTPHAELFKLAYANPEQIRSISMIVDTVNDIDVLQATSQLVGSSSMSLLELILVQSYAACPFPDDLFSTPGSVPRLQAVRLLNCTVDLNTQRFRNLRVLEILAEHSRTGILLPTFCKAIREMRSLEILKLDGVFSLERETAESELPSPLRIEPFELPSLRKVSLKSDQLIGLDIFEFIRAPRIRDLTIATFLILLIKDIDTIYSFLQIGPSTSTDKRRNVQRMGIASVHESLNWSITHSQSDGGGHKRTLSLNAIGVGLERLWASIIHDSVHSFKLTLSPRELPPEAPVLYVMLRLADLRALAVLQVPFMAFAEESFLRSFATDHDHWHRSDGR